MSKRNGGPYYKDYHYTPLVLGIWECLVCRCHEALKVVFGERSRRHLQCWLCGECCGGPGHGCVVEETGDLGVNVHLVWVLGVGMEELY